MSPDFKLAIGVAFLIVMLLITVSFLAMSEEIGIIEREFLISYVR
jgi:hypothetical protein